MSVEQAQNKLDNYVRLRCEIAHRTSPSEVVRKETVLFYLNLVERLAKRTQSFVNKYLLKVTGKEAWPS